MRAVATPQAKPVGASRRVLKIVSKCTTEAEFIAVFQRFCADTSLFVVTRTPKPVGSSSRLSITLADGKPMLVGAGRVIDSFKGQDNEFKRPGMRLALTDLDADSRATMARLNAAKKQAAARASATAGAASGNGAAPRGPTKAARATIMVSAVPPPALPRTPIKIPNIPRVAPKVRPEATPIPERVAPPETDPVTEVNKPGAPPPARPSDAVPEAIPASDDAVPETVSDGDDEVTKVSAESGAQRAGAGQLEAEAEARAEHSDFILPANPFGELTDANLEAFVECTLYEETGSIAIDSALAASDEETSSSAADRESEEEEATSVEARDNLPAWWPQGGGDSHTPLPPAAPGMLSTEASGEHSPGPPTGPGAPAPMAARAPTPVPGATPAYGGMGGPQHMRPMTPVPMMAPAAAPQDPNLLTPFPGVARQRSPWLPIIVTAGITALLTLLIGYALWGSGKKPKTQPTPAPASETAEAAAPAKAVAPSPATADQDKSSDENAVAADDKAGNGDETASEGKAADEGDKSAQDGQAADDQAADDQAADDRAADQGDNSAQDDKATGDLGTEAAAAKPGSCTLTISSNADDPVAYVDGKKLGTLPLSAEVPCKAKKLTLSHPRYEKRTMRLSLHEGEVTKMKAMMHRPIFQLKILSRPSGATVTVDGHRRGKTPVSTKVRGFIRSTVKVSKPGYKTYVKRVYPRSKSTTIRASLGR